MGGKIICKIANITVGKPESDYCSSCIMMHGTQKIVAYILVQSKTHKLVIYSENSTISHEDL